MTELNQSLEHIAARIGKRSFHLSMLVCIGAFIGLVAYYFFGDDLISNIYRERSFEFLNQALRGKDSRSLEHYIGVANRIVYGGLLTAVFVALSPLFYAYVVQFRASNPSHCPGGDLSARTAAIAFAFVLLVSATPLAFVTSPPLYDYPFHIARAYILDSWQASPALQGYYDLRSFVLPNMGMDLSLLLLGKLLPIEAAGRVFVALSFALTLSGSFFLHATLFQRPSLWPLASSFFLFNGILLIGFTNYLLGIGLILWAVALWIRAGKLNVPFRILCGTLLSTTLFFAHLVSLGLFAIIVAGYELQRSIVSARENVRLAVTDLVTGAAIFLAPIMLFLRSSTSEESDSRIAYAHPFFEAKLQHLESVFSNYPLLDILQVGFLLALAVLVAFHGRFRLARPMLFPAALLVVTFIGMPWEALSAGMIDYRLPIFICLFLLGASDLELRNQSWNRAVITGIAVFLSLRAVLVSAIWSSDEAVIHEYRAALSELPADSILFVTKGSASFDEIVSSLGHQTPVNHLGSFATIERNIFVPAIFAHPSQQPISVSSDYAALKQFQGHAPISITSAAQLDSIVTEIGHIAEEQCLRDRSLYLLMHDPVAPAPRHTEVVATGSRFILARIRRHDAVDCPSERSGPGESGDCNPSCRTNHTPLAVSSIK